MTPKPTKKSAKSAAPKTSAPKTSASKKKLYILDTNVLLADPHCLFSFEEHDIFLPMVVLEEMDNHKKGLSDVARNGRQASRMIDQILSTHDNGIDTGVSLAKASGGVATGHLIFESEITQYDMPTGLPSSKADNTILAVVMHLRNRNPKREVILVSKDINIRIKARALNLQAEDYLNDQVVDDADLLPTGLYTVDEQFWSGASNKLESLNEGRSTVYKVPGKALKDYELNEFLHFKDNDLTLRVAEKGKLGVLKTVTDYTSPGHSVCGISARNVEQNCALNLLMDPNIDLVMLLGQAGTGKTLLTLAAALHQTILTKGKNQFSEIIVTRATIPVGEDIGFLPGDEEDKTAVWHDAIMDSLEVLDSTGGLSKNNMMLQAKGKIKFKAMAFMRGRTFINKFLIIDEAQNLTADQIKTLITRSGPGTKIACLGNLSQIDSAYITEGNSGLTHAVTGMRGLSHTASLTLKDCVRSRLADAANEHL